FEGLFKTHYEALCRCAFRIVRDEAVTEDIVQEVFYSLWSKRTTLQVDTGFKSYLYKASVNGALNHLRKQKNLTSREAVFQEGLLTNSNTADHAIHYKETGNRINSVIDALPPACRTVFILSRYENMSHREIAERLNISVNTVENHMSRALKFLRKHLIIFFPGAVVVGALLRVIL
ncbi:MAG TPA: RNA polymerase sigma-70 factor, partial [Anseongella sp.]|nr:RNA polymerase sigma-70 factor [Anseongella sp.]